MPLSKEEITKRQVARRHARRQDGRATSVRIDTTPETKSEWQAYAKYKGLPLATLIRQCIDQSMEKDQWTYNPENEK